MSEIKLGNFDERWAGLTLCEYLRSNGASALNDGELINLILMTNPTEMHSNEGSKKVKEVLAILEKSGGKVSFDDLMDIEGLYSHQIACLLSGIELARRLYYPLQTTIDRPVDVYNLLRHLADREEENFFCITLNGAQEVMKVHHISKGLVDKAIVHPREVFAPAITTRATAIIVAHNHPSGNVAPSNDDYKVTKRLQDSGVLLGIPLLDHIIFSWSSYFSFLDNKNDNEISLA